MVETKQSLACVSSFHAVRHMQQHVRFSTILGFRALQYTGIYFHSIQLSFDKKMRFLTEPSVPSRPRNHLLYIFLQDNDMVFSPFSNILPPRATLTQQFITYHFLPFPVVSRVSLNRTQLESPAEAEHQVESGLLLDVVV
ncbi:unnamed protein product [Ascophyllum nodosum]